MNLLRTLSVLSLLLVGVIGCGNPDAVVPEDTTAVSSKDQLKTRLQDIAKTGVAGSGLAGMREMIQPLNKPALMQDLTKLENAKTPAQVKAVAQSMLKKLE